MQVYNLKGLRTAMFEQADWAPAASPDIVTRTNNLINRAYKQLVHDAPFLFWQTESRWRVQPDVVPTLTTDLLKATTDAWVLETELAPGTTDAVEWAQGYEWSCRTLVVKEPSTGEWRHIRIREVWTTVGAPNRQYISLMQPWRNTSDTGIEYRILDTERTLPDTLVSLQAATRIDPDSGVATPIKVVSQEALEGVTPGPVYPTTGVGAPLWMYRRSHQSLQAPTRKPEVVEAADPAWVGPEPEGQYQYLFTYVMGDQEVYTHGMGPEEQSSTASAQERHEPYWESGPSPESDTADTATAKSITVRLPNIDFMLGFHDAAALRYRRSGVRKRIYRKRVLSRPAGGDTYSTWEDPNKYFFLDEVEGHITSYVDDGSITPDYNRPFRPVHGYQTFNVFPRPSQTTTFSLRYLAEPPPLEDDQDLPVVHADGMECLFWLAFSLFAEMCSQTDAAMSYGVKYRDRLGYLTKRRGDLMPGGQVVSRRTARIRGRGTRRTPPGLADF